jgi:UDP-N-acetylmuramoyl-L-alanyl-D-glutamate--2,6-diaminopimelate ligase
MRTAPAITLRELAGAVAASGHLLAGPRDADARVEITSLAYDSRDVGPGALFCCVPGFAADGHDHAQAAVAAGAVALIVQRPLGLGVAELRVDSVRRAMGPAAARFFGDPSAAMPVVGVTGTNGKTTTAFLVRELLGRTGTPCGLLGTVKSVVGGVERPLARTTPEAIDVQALLRAMVDAGDGACAMEVSSHALELGRVQGTRFAAAIFTNLTQDHLDFHSDMEDYFQAKRRLFTGPPQVAVVNVADPYGRGLAAELPEAVTFAVADETARAADFLAREVTCGAAGSRYLLDSAGDTREVFMPIPGRFNVANALGAIAAAHALGVSVDAAVAALSQPVPVPGRMEPVEEGQPFTVLVDYAHTPDSLARVLAAARELGREGQRPRVICVFGAGGDRDRGKRPLMGRAAALGADVLVVTSDNPRSEDPEAIIAEIVAGVREGRREDDAPGRPPAASDVRVVADRRQAIADAIDLADVGDVVVIAGKGHERGQVLADGVVTAFDDVAVARELLRSTAVGAS